MAGIEHRLQDSPRAPGSKGADEPILDVTDIDLDESAVETPYLREWLRQAFAEQRRHLIQDFQHELRQSTCSHGAVLPLHRASAKNDDIVRAHKSFTELAKYQGSDMRELLHVDSPRKSRSQARKTNLSEIRVVSSSKKAVEGSVSMESVDIVEKQRRSEKAAREVEAMEDMDIDSVSSSENGAQGVPVEAALTTNSTMQRFAVFRAIDEIMNSSSNYSREDESDVQRLCKSLCPCLAFLFARCGKKRTRASQMALDYKNPKIHHHWLTQDQRTAISNRCDVIAGWLIVANCVVIIIQMQWQGYEGQIAMGTVEDDGSWKNAKESFWLTEHIFNALFILEVVARGFLAGPWSLVGKSNILDTTIVLLSSFQLYVLDTLELDMGGNISLFRMLRFIRFVRVLRLVRVMKLFSELRVLVKTVISSFRALLWSMVLLLIIIVMSALLLCELLKEFIRDSSADMTLRLWVWNYYGTSTRAIYTLFEVTLAGCWPRYFRPLIENISGWYVLFSVLYITLVVFAIIRIITALFLKETLTIAGNDAEMMVNEQMKKTKAYVGKLQKVFEAVDVAKAGKLTLQEFEMVVSIPKVKTWLQVLDLDFHDAQALFRLLDDGDGEVTYDEFLQGVMRLKGQARSIDIVGIMRTGDKTLEAMRNVAVFLEDIHTTLEVIAADSKT